MAKRIKVGGDYYIDPETKQIVRDNSNQNRTTQKVIRLTPEEKRKIIRLAKKHALGNTSAYMTYAALNYTPPQ